MIVEVRSSHGSIRGYFDIPPRLLQRPSVRFARAINKRHHGARLIAGLLEYDSDPSFQVVELPVYKYAVEPTFSKDGATYLEGVIRHCLKYDGPMSLLLELRDFRPISGHTNMSGANNDPL